jgi:hypothetical protein
MSGCDREAQLQASWDWTKDKSLMFLVFMTRYILFLVRQATYPNPNVYGIRKAPNKHVRVFDKKPIRILQHFQTNKPVCC